MKKMLFLLPLFLLAGYGCARHEYDVLRKIPVYQQPAKKFDTTATIEFTPDTSSELNKVFIAALKKHGYNDVVYNNRFRDTERNRTKVVTLLSLSRKQLFCQNGSFLETQIIVLVRNPGVIWKDKLYYTTPRYFQAYSQIALKGDYVLDKIYKSELQKVIQNLFTVEVFREALEPDKKVIAAISDNAVIPDAVECWNISKLFQNSKNGDMHEAAKWAFFALEQGHVEAADYFVKHCLFNNFIGESKLYTATLKKIAEMGNPVVQIEYALLFEQGNLVPQNWDSAFFWMKKAAEQNHPIAQYNMGVYHENGRGTARNIPLAISWYQKSASNGNADAAQRLKIVDKKSK